MTDPIIWDRRSEAAGRKDPLNGAITNVTMKHVIKKTAMFSYHTKMAFRNAMSPGSPGPGI